MQAITKTLRTKKEIFVRREVATSEERRRDMHKGYADLRYDLRQIP